METTKTLKSDGLGQRIRSLRLQRQMTGTELARHCGVTKGLISQIERSITIPSLDVLARIANALEVSMGQLLDTYGVSSRQQISNVDDLPYDPVVRKDKRTVIAIPKVSQVYELLTPTFAGQIEFSILKISPLTSEERLTYTHPGEECLLVLEGSLMVYLGDRTYHLEEGDSMTYSATIPHGYKCEGSRPAVVIMAETPPSFLNFVMHHTSGSERVAGQGYVDASDST